VQTITPSRAAELLAANTTNRPLSRPVVRGFAEAMRRDEWLVTHQGIAFDVNGVLVDGQHRGRMSSRCRVGTTGARHCPPG
jgi:hypothetical protein